MNTYKPDVEPILSAAFGKEKLDFKTAFAYLSDKMALLSNPASEEFKMLIRATMARVHCSADQAIHVLLNFNTQVSLELSYMFKGADLIVQDRAVIDAMLRTDISALMSDVKLPYNYCSFIFPSGIPLGFKDYEITGCMLVSDVTGTLHDLKLRLLKSDIDACATNGLPVDAKGVAEDRQLAFFTGLRRGGARDPEGISWLRFKLDEPLEALSNHKTEHSIPINGDDAQATRSLAYLCLGLCLYLQTEEGLAALQAVPAMKTQGHSPCVGRLAKKRKCFVIRDLITPKLLRESESDGNSDRHVAPHLRRLHLRALRHDKFKRNPNGSVRMIWIKPTVVGIADDIKGRPQRRI